MIKEEMAVKQIEKKKTYSYDDVYSRTLEYFNGDELASRVWISKYAIKDSFGNIYEQSPDDMHWRLAKEIARIELKYPNPLSVEEIYKTLKDFKYIVPQGGPMTGIGNEFQIASLSNCFVIGQSVGADSYGGIMLIDQEQVQLMKRRGGVGHDLSHIRPKGSPVMNSALTSTGIVPFMERYSNSTREVAQDGRRGALMLSISIKHPDSEQFIDAKLEQGKITGANISVKIDNDFMEAVANNKPYTQQYPIDSQNPVVKKSIDARKIWNKIIQNAWKSAEPGILFWDTIINESIPDCYADQGYKTVSTNPCGEIPLCPYDSCRLLALNLYEYVDNPFAADAKFNFDLFAQHVHAAVRIMDDIIDLELEKIDSILAKIKEDPEEEEVKRVERRLWENIREKAKEGRRMGLGTTAEGDMLAALSLRYGSDNAIDFSVEVHKNIAIEAYRASVELAKERGAFSIYSHLREKNNPFIQRLKEQDPKLIEDMQKHGRRNIAMLTIAPTGTTSLMTQTTSGIEPVFMPVYKRRTKINPNDKKAKTAFVDELGDSWQEFNVFHHKFIVWLEKNGYKYEEIKDADDEQIQKLIEQSPYYKATSGDIDWVNKVRMQGEIQKWVDHSISVTINLPESTTVEMVDKLYLTAWKSGCKGVTVYRDGSRAGVLISNKKSDKKSFRRPDELQADVIRFNNNNERWIAFIGAMDGKPYEIFTGLEDEEGFFLPKNVHKGIIIKRRFEDRSKRYDFQYRTKYGNVTIEGLSYKFNPEFWNYAKLISGVLRQGMPIVNVVNLISSLHFRSESINNWRNGVERALKRYIPNGTKPKGKVKCDHCESTNVIYQEGCLICQDCATSKCS